jgi:hypothetical protein
LFLAITVNIHDIVKKLDQSMEDQFVFYPIIYRGWSLGEKHCKQISE